MRNSITHSGVKNGYTHLWLKDDGGAAIRGGVDVRGREGSIEVTEIQHNVVLPADRQTGKITGTRIHTSYYFDKEIDDSIPYLYKALTTGQRLKNAELKFYSINDSGQEVEYFNTLLEGVRVTSIMPVMLDIKVPIFEKKGHMECVELVYERITWRYVDGNIIHSDSWNERKGA